jgi:hypothetical protein
MPGQISQNILNRLVPALMLLLPIAACNQAGQAEDARAVDSGMRKTDTPSPVAHPIDNGRSGDMAVLKPWFEKKEGAPIDSTQKIPRSLIAKFIKGANFDTLQYVSDVNPIDLFRNRYGSFFLIKVNCSYGGACANFYLLSFDNKERYRKTETLGDETGEESFISLFSYKLRSDTVLATWVVRYSQVEDSSEEKVDTLQRNVLYLANR